MPGVPVALGAKRLDGGTAHHSHKMQTPKEERNTQRFTERRGKRYFFRRLGCSMLLFCGALIKPLISTVSHTAPMDPKTLPPSVSAAP